MMLTAQERMLIVDDNNDSRIFCRANNRTGQRRFAGRRPLLYENGDPGRLRARCLTGGCGAESNQQRGCGNSRIAILAKGRS